MNKKDLLVICFHNVVIKNKTPYYKPSHGFFLNQLCNHFDVSLFSNHISASIREKEGKEASLKLEDHIYLYSSNGSDNGFYNSPIKSLKKIFLLFKSISKTDIVHIFTPSFTPLAAIPIAKILKKKITIYVAAEWERAIEDYYERNNRGVKIQIKKLFMKMSKYVALKTADIVLSTNYYNKDKMSAHNKNIHVTQPLVVNSQFKFSKTIESSNNSSNTELLFIGNLIPTKKIDVLLKSFSLVKSQISACSLKIIGDFDNLNYKSQIKDLEEKLDLQGNIHWMGWIGDQNKLKEEMKNCRVLILPSIGEGFPKVIYEAQSIGLPVVTSDLPNYQSMLVNKENAMLVTQNDIQGFAKAISSLISDQNLYNKIRTQGWEFAKKRLKLSAADQYAELLNEFYKGNKV